MRMSLQHPGSTSMGNPATPLEFTSIIHHSSVKATTATTTADSNEAFSFSSSLPSSLAGNSGAVLLTPEAKSNNDNASAEPKTGFQIVHYIVSEHPMAQGRIATVYEMEAQQDRHRIGVYSYTGTMERSNDGLSQQSLHASFELEGPPIMFCWTSFPRATVVENKKHAPTDGSSSPPAPHPVLCVLCNSTTISIWDVYPNNEAAAGGGTAALSKDWTVTLPFECCNIMPLPYSGTGETATASLVGAGGGGLLLQRQADPVDFMVAANSNNDSDDEEEDHEDHPVFQQPPHVDVVVAETPMQGAPGVSVLPWSAAAAATTNADYAALAAPSLFSLQHPLEDVLPVGKLVLPPAPPLAFSPPTAAAAIMAGDDGGSGGGTEALPFCTVWEDLIWMGRVEWTEKKSDRTLKSCSTVDQNHRHGAVLAVTYHSQKNRHAIWMVRDAPESPPAPAVYQQTHQHVQHEHADLLFAGAGNRALVDFVPHPNGYWPDDHQRDEFAAAAGHAATPGILHGADAEAAATATRKAALADALGLAGSSTANTSRVSASAGAVPMVRSPKPIFSPRGAGATNQSMQHHHHHGVDASGLMSGAASGDRGFIPPNSPSFAAAAATMATHQPPHHPQQQQLHASVAFQCLYEDSTLQPTTASGSGKSQFWPKASQVFSISNDNGSGELLLCLVSPTKAATSCTAAASPPGTPRTGGADTSAGDGNNKEIRFFAIRPIMTAPRMDTTEAGEERMETPHMKSTGNVETNLEQEVASLTIHALPQKTRTCRDAVPLKVTPRPACFRSNNSSEALNSNIPPAAQEQDMCVDWLLLTTNNTISFCRATQPLLDCRLKVPTMQTGCGSDSSMTISGLSDPVHNSVTVHYRCGSAENSNATSGGVFTCSTRVQLDLRCRGGSSTASALTERVLSAIDATLAESSLLGGSTASAPTAPGSIVSPSSKTKKTADERNYLVSLGICLRADVFRLGQQPQEFEGSERSDVDTTRRWRDDAGWHALETVLHSLAESSLRASRGGIGSRMKGVTSSSGMSDDALNRKAPSPWELLLQSDYHKSYAEASGAKLGFLLKNNRSNADRIEDSTSKSSDCPNRAVLTLEDMQSLAAIHWKKAATTYPGVALLPLIFDSLHLLYEDCKLRSSSRFRDLKRLRSLLVRMCSLAVSSAAEHDDNKAAAIRFLRYYRLDDDQVQSAVEEATASPPVDANVTSRRTSGRTRKSPLSTAPSSSGAKQLRLTSFIEPPCFLLWVDGIISTTPKTNVSYFSVAGLDGINAACSKLRSAFRILSILFADRTSSTRDLDVVHALIGEGYTDACLIQEDFPPGVALPILEVLHRSRNNVGSSSTGWSSAAWSLVGRDDLSKNVLLAVSADAGLPTVLPDGAVSPTVSLASPCGSDDAFADKDNDGLLPLEESSAMLFPEDNRIHEAARLLRSSRPIFLRVPRPVEIGDHDYERCKQKKLLLLCKRALALPVGRGMLTIGGLRPVPAELLPVPELCLKGVLPPTNASLALDDSECPSDMRVWSEFHNGVAAGLRLPSSGESNVKITRTWIIYNRPSPANNPNQSDSTNEDGANSQPHRKAHTHGGLLLALGLRGHLTALDMSDIYDYLTLGSVTTTVGVLLGMAANKRGSCDMAVSKMLCLHIPSLIPHHFSAIDVASSVQAAAVTGAGLLFQRSSHRMMTEFLLNEIGKRPDSDASAFDREAYTLACGLALGMVNLCLGEQSKDGKTDRAAGIADLRVEERLYRYIMGGTDTEESHRTRESNDRFSLGPSASPNGDNERCSTIFEGELINTHVTSPGATLALGLMYLKTGNHTIASALALPDTHFLLEFVRPDFLSLRVVSRAIILWDEVKPTKQWIEDQIPAVVRSAYQEMRSAASRAMGGEASAEHKTSGGAPDYDRRAVRQIYAHVLAGACMGLGLRFAGTGNEDAKAALFERVLELQMLREGNDPVAVASRPEFPILDACLGCAALSLAMVLAGTGDLEALKLFKILRWRCEEDSRYGIHMVYGMACGLLFLGGGTCTLGREPEDIAALITAFFPRYPTTTSDNQYHLQALRHLYALAVKRRELRAIDVDTNKAVSVPVKLLNNTDDESLSLDLPCLLRNYETPYTELCVASNDYYPLRLALTGRACTLFVKRRHGVVPHTRTGQNPGPRAEPALQTYRDYLIRPNDPHIFHRILQESCDAPEAASVYLALLLGPDKWWNMRLLRTYYQASITAAESSSAPTVKPLLNVSLLLACLHQMAERSLTRCEENEAIRHAMAFYAD